MRKEEKGDRREVIYVLTFGLGVLHNSHDRCSTILQSYKQLLRIFQMLVLLFLMRSRTSILSEAQQAQDISKIRVSVPTYHFGITPA